MTTMRRTTGSGPLRIALTAVLAALTAATAASVAAAGQAPPLPTVTIDLGCPENEFTVTIDNQTAATYEVTVSATPDFEQVVSVGPDDTVEVVIEYTSGPMDIVVTGDADFPPTALTTFGCPRQVDLTFTTTEGTAIDLEMPCPIGDRDLEHGTLRAIGNFRSTWTPDPGFVGQESIHYECPSSFEQNGTITFVVDPAQALPAEPVPDEPTFTG